MHCLEETSNSKMVPFFRISGLPLNIKTKKRILESVVLFDNTNVWFFGRFHIVLFEGIIIQVKAINVKILRA